MSDVKKQLEELFVKMDFKPILLEHIRKRYKFNESHGWIPVKPKTIRTPLKCQIEIHEDA